MGNLVINTHSHTINIHILFLTSSYKQKYKMWISIKSCSTFLLTTINMLHVIRLLEKSLSLFPISHLNTYNYILHLKKGNRSILYHPTLTQLGVACPSTWFLPPHWPWKRGSWMQFPSNKNGYAFGLVSWLEGCIISLQGCIVRDRYLFICLLYNI